MRRFFVLFIAFLTAFQLLDESLDDVGLKPVAPAAIIAFLADSSSSAAQEAASYADPASQSPHADLSDSVVRWSVGTVATEPPVQRVAAPVYVFPVLTFPMLDPPRVRA